MRTALVAASLFALVAAASAAESGISSVTALPFTVDGEPIMGTYAVQTLDGLRLVDEVGMNVVIGGHEMLDPSTEMGAFMQEKGIKVMLHLTDHIYGRPRSGSFVDETQTEIPLAEFPFRPLPDSGVVQIDDELIRYGRWTKDALLDCERGYDGTAAAAHHEGIILFLPEPCAEEVRKVMDAPNLWGYYVLDDSPGDALSALRGLYSTIRSVDPNPQRHPVAAGYGSIGSLCNFDTGVCDLMLIYWYPINDNRYDRLLISRNVQRMLTAARARVPGVPFAGVYQAFYGPAAGAGTTPPTPQQVREQMEDFWREGACGLVSYACEINEELPGWAAIPSLHATLREVHGEMLDGGVVSAEPPAMATARIQPKGMWQHPNDLPGVIPAWYVVAPIDDPEQGCLSLPHPPESDWSVDAVYTGRNGRPVRWVRRETQAGVVGLIELYSVAGSAAYAMCEITSPEEQQAQLLLGRDDDLLVWLNGEEIVRYEGSHGLDPDEYAVPVTLPEGTSSLRVKSCNRAGMWGFSVRVTDPEGNALEGIAFKP